MELFSIVQHWSSRTKIVTAFKKNLTPKQNTFVHSYRLAIRCFHLYAYEVFFGSCPSNTFRSPIFEPLDYRT